MAKVRVKELVEYLKNLGVEDALIPALIMTASFESGMQTGVTGTNPNQTKDYGVFQVNVEEFYDDETDKPDDTITTFFDKVNKEFTKDELKDKLNNNEKFSAQFTAHYLERLRNNPQSFETGGDPLVKWTEYRARVKPFLQGQKIEGRSAEDIQDAINSYFEAYLQVHNMNLKQELKDDMKELSDPDSTVSKVLHQYYIPNLKTREGRQELGIEK